MSDKNYYLHRLTPYQWVQHVLSSKDKLSRVFIQAWSGNSAPLGL